MALANTFTAVMALWLQVMMTLAPGLTATESVVLKPAIFEVHTTPNAAADGLTSDFIPLTDDELDSAHASQIHNEYGPTGRRSLREPHTSDGRILWNVTEYPYSAMGRIERSDGATCTATLVGPRHIATARHCFLPYKGVAPTIKFQPNFFDTAWRGSSTVVKRLYKPTSFGLDHKDFVCYYRDDFAVGVLADRLGDTLGWLTPKAATATHINQSVFFHLGYPDLLDVTHWPYRESNIAVTSLSLCDGTGPLATTATITAGHSGGPLWSVADGARYLYGVAVTAESNRAALFAGNWRLVNAVKRALESYP